MLTFGLRKKHSTSLCTNVFKQTVDYYRRHGSHVLPILLILTKRSIMSTLVAVL